MQGLNGTFYGTDFMTLTVTPSHSFPATDGQTFDLFPVPSECTVAQAAKFLDMSEGCVEELLEDGIIVSRLKNGERLVHRDSLLEFGTDYREGLAILAEITRESQEMGLYD